MPLSTPAKVALGLVLFVLLVAVSVGGAALYYRLRYSRRQPQQPLSQAFRDEQMDVVYMWVDGADPAFLARKGADPSGDCRYADNGELEYSVGKTIENMGGMLGHIYIVTQQQTPAWYDPERHHNITIVDHREVMGDLVTFQSVAIENHLHNIPGLSRWFVFIQDDQSINHPITKEHLFYADDRPRYMYDGWGFNPTFARVVTLNQEPIAASFQFTEREYLRKHPEHRGKHHFMRPHGPTVIHTETLRRLADECRDEIAAMVVNPFRTNRDFSLFMYYMMHEVDAGRAVVASDYMARYVFISNSVALNNAQMQRFFGDPDEYFICLNDTRTANFERTSRAIRAFLQARSVPGGVPSVHSRKSLEAARLAAAAAAPVVEVLDEPVDAAVEEDLYAAAKA